jgi:hypothetical protein
MITSRVAPSTDMEELLADIWAAELKVGCTLAQYFQATCHLFEQCFSCR